MPRQPGFDSNVFINCPFDTPYQSLLRPLLFTTLCAGFNPRIASERSDSAEQRIDKICELVESSKYSIHDLSRIQSSKKGEYYRLNMPFELGIDYGCRKYGRPSFRNKKFLVLAEDRHNYGRALSDLSGIDIKYHLSKPEKIIREARNWFVETVNLRNIKSASGIWDDFNEFMAEFDTARRMDGFEDEDIFDMPVPEFVSFIRDWLKANSLIQRGVDH
jgi:hypothetical protein